MQSLLRQLNSVPGVIGTMVCDSGGTLLAHTFPPLFEAPMLERAARLLADGGPGLETVTGPIGMIDLKYSDARIVVKPVAGAQMLFLCTAAASLQPLAISTSIAAPKIEKLVAARSAAPQTTAAAGGQLYQAVQRIDAAIERKKLDRFKVRGVISIKAGFSVGFIDDETPDDPEKLAQLLAAATTVLGEPI